MFTDSDFGFLLWCLWVFAKYFLIAWPACIFISKPIAAKLNKTPINWKMVCSLAIKPHLKILSFLANSVTMLFTVLALFPKGNEETESESISTTRDGEVSQPYPSMDASDDYYTGANTAPNRNYY